MALGVPFPRRLLARRYWDRSWQCLFAQENTMSRKAEPLTLSEEDHWRLRRIVESKVVMPRSQLRARAVR